LQDFYTFIGRRLTELVENLLPVVSAVETELHESVGQMRKAEKLPQH
jgi:hypothetical protein